MKDSSENMSVETLMMVRYVEPSQTGIQSLELLRYAAGYVVQGTMYIYDGDQRKALDRGTAFCLGTGRYYVEAIPDDQAPFELVLFYYTPKDLHQILLHLHLTYGMQISTDFSNTTCRITDQLVIPAWASLQTFFQNLNSSLRSANCLREDSFARLKMTELVYLLIAQNKENVIRYVVNQSDSERTKFEHQIYTQIFQNTTIEDLSRLTGRSMTAFKKEFYRHFGMSPHQWYLNQRLKYARVLLTASTQSIGEISDECCFPNTSHFIKLFKRAYHVTPSVYRSEHRKAWEREKVACEQ